MRGDCPATEPTRKLSDRRCRFSGSRTWEGPSREHRRTTPVHGAISLGVTANESTSDRGIAETPRRSLPPTVAPTTPTRRASLGVARCSVRPPKNRRSSASSLLATVLRDNAFGNVPASPMTSHVPTPQLRSARLCRVRCADDRRPGTVRTANSTLAA
jgi:hypothetical protein